MGSSIAVTLFLLMFFAVGCDDGQPDQAPSGGDVTVSGSSVEGMPASDLFNAHLPGNDAPADCVDVDHTMQMVRSGDFIAGDFGDYVKRWKPSDPTRSKLFWLPRHPQPNARLTVIATSTSGKRHEFSGGPLSTSKNGAMYPSSIPLPSKGVWTLRVTAGNDAACFVVTL